MRIRKAALAFAEVVDPAGMFPLIARRPPVKPVLDEHRAAVKTLAPQIEAARAGERRQDLGRRSIEKVGEHWEAMRAAYLKSAVDPRVNARIVKAIDNMTGPGPRPSKLIAVRVAIAGYERAQ